jgi:hypothetical protein
MDCVLTMHSLRIDEFELIVWVFGLILGGWFCVGLYGIGCWILWAGYMYVVLDDFGFDLSRNFRVYKATDLGE